MTLAYQPLGIKEPCRRRRIVIFLVCREIPYEQGLRSAAVTGPRYSHSHDARSFRAYVRLCCQCAGTGDSQAIHDVFKTCLQHVVCDRLPVRKRTLVGTLVDQVHVRRSAGHALRACRGGGCSASRLVRPSTCLPSRLAHGVSGLMYFHLLSISFTKLSIHFR